MSVHVCVYMWDRMVPYGFHNSLRVCSSPTAPPSLAYHPLQSSLTHLHTLPAPSFKNAQFFFLYVAFPPSCPPPSFSLSEVQSESQLCKGKKERQHQILYWFLSQKSIEVIYGLSAWMKRQIPPFNTFWILLEPHWTINWTLLDLNGLLGLILLGSVGGCFKVSAGVEFWMDVGLVSTGEFLEVFAVIWSKQMPILNLLVSKYSDQIIYWKLKVNREK